MHKLISILCINFAFFVDVNLLILCIIIDVNLCINLANPSQAKLMHKLTSIIHFYQNINKIFLVLRFFPYL